MNEPEARAAHDAAQAVVLGELRRERTGWRRAAEVAGIVAVGMLLASGVIPW